MSLFPPSEFKALQERKLPLPQSINERSLQEIQQQLEELIQETMIDDPLLDLLRSVAVKQESEGLVIRMSGRAREDFEMNTVYNIGIFNWEPLHGSIPVIFVPFSKKKKSFAGALVLCRDGMGERPLSMEIPNLARHMSDLVLTAQKIRRHTAEEERYTRECTAFDGERPWHYDDYYNPMDIAYPTIDDFRNCMRWNIIRAVGLDQKHPLAQPLPQYQW